MAPLKVPRYTHFWLRIVVTLLSFAHARTWFLLPSRNTRSEDAFSRVRPTVVLGNVGVTLKVPGRTWYESTEAKRFGSAEMLG